MKTRKSHRKFWMVFFASFMFLFLVGSIIGIGFFYTDYDGRRHALACNTPGRTFYIFQDHVYVPVWLENDGTLDAEKIPYYYGSVKPDVLQLQFEKETFPSQALKGEYLGRAEADFYYDTKEQQHVVDFYAVKSEQRILSSQMLWAESDGEAFLAVRLSKPYSRKMLSPNTLQSYAAKMIMVIDAETPITCNLNLLADSKYSVNDTTWSFRFQRNWYFFWHDLKSIFD